MIWIINEVPLRSRVYLLFIILVTEVLLIVKFSQGQFPDPIPPVVWCCWTVGGLALVTYPIIKVRLLSYLYPVGQL
jgi:phosphatidylserine synthase 2